MDYIENKTFEEIRVGDATSIARTLQPADIGLLADLFGNSHGDRTEHGYAGDGAVHDAIANAFWGSALISTLLETRYPGPGTVYIHQALHYGRAVALGDVITVTVTVREKFELTRHVTLDCKCVNQDGQVVISGAIEVLAPGDKVRRPNPMLAQERLQDRTARYQHLLELAKGLEPITVAVVHPCDRDSLAGAVFSAEAGLIVPLLVGPEKKIRNAAQAANLDISSYRIVPTEHSHAAAARAVALARDGSVEALMKGSLHTDELMEEVVRSDSGLRTVRRLSHVFIMDVPTYPRPLLITDAAINIEPDLETKRDIVQNAIDLALVLHITDPKVAILSAVETVTPKLRSTMDAAALCKMAERGQITGGVLDGPLGFDNAVSMVAARTKGIRSAVAGRADIVVVPDLESGNMIAKQLEYLADAQIAGVVMGARVPIVLVSRADSAQSRIASCAVALLMARGRKSIL